MHFYKPRFLGDFSLFIICSECKTATRFVFLLMYLVSIDSFYRFKTFFSGKKSMKITLAILLTMCFFTNPAEAQQYLGRLSKNPYQADSVSNPYG